MDQISFDDLFTEKIPVESKTSLSFLLYKSILELLESDISSALEICEALIKEEKVSNERFSTNKPKVYIKVCSILDEMVKEGRVIFIENQNKKDRIYRLK